MFEYCQKKIQTVNRVKVVQQFNIKSCTQPSSPAFFSDRLAKGSIRSTMVPVDILASFLVTSSNSSGQRFSREGQEEDQTTTMPSQ